MTACSRNPKVNSVERNHKAIIRIVSSYAAHNDQMPGAVMAAQMAHDLFSHFCINKLTIPVRENTNQRVADQQGDDLLRLGEDKEFQDDHKGLILTH